MNQKKVLVFGSGISGIGATNLLTAVGKSAILYDGNTAIDVKQLEKQLSNASQVEILLGDIPSEVIQVFGETCSKRIDVMVNSLVTNSQNGNIAMSDDLARIFHKIHDFMYERVYLCDRAKIEEKKAPYIIKALYDYFVENYKKLPLDIINISHKEGVERAVCDYIAGMTDAFAINLFKDIFIPKSWQGLKTTDNNII